MSQGDIFLKFVHREERLSRTHGDAAAGNDIVEPYLQLGFAEPHRRTASTELKNLQTARDVDYSTAITVNESVRKKLDGMGSSLAGKKHDLEFEIYWETELDLMDSIKIFLKNPPKSAATTSAATLNCNFMAT